MPQYSKIEEDNTKKAKIHDTIYGIDISIEKLDIYQDRIKNMWEKIKAEILELVEMSNSVKIWIQLNIPRIEDGNNFGVSIQEETVNELGRAEDSGFALLESLCKYYATRGKLISKVKKYPDIMDYRWSVLELDQKQTATLRLNAIDLRNNYAILFDSINKNMDKLMKPRTSNVATLY